MICTKTIPRETIWSMEIYINKDKLSLSAIVDRELLRPGLETRLPAEGRRPGDGVRSRVCLPRPVLGPGPRRDGGCGAQGRHLPLAELHC